VDVTDFWLVVASMVAFAGAVGASAWKVRAGWGGGRAWDFGFLLAGFVPLTAALFVRGQAEGSCPLNSLYDVLVFLAWSLVLIYLLVGSSYRLSLLGFFTAPLALILLAFATFGPIDRGFLARRVADPWVETHAALSVIAYGAFGLACVAGVMYLVQEHQLKSHRFSNWFLSLPPINDLAVANRRLLMLGFGLLTAGFLSGVVSGQPVNSMKFWGSVGIWVLYGGFLGAWALWPWRPGRVAKFSILAFLVAMAALPALQYLSTTP